MQTQYKTKKAALREKSDHSEPRFTGWNQRYAIIAALLSLALTYSPTHIPALTGISVNVVVSVIMKLYLASINKWVCGATSNSAPIPARASKLIVLSPTGETS